MGSPKNCLAPSALRRHEAARSFKHRIESTLRHGAKAAFETLANRLMRKAREAMLTAVETFNHPHVEFKSKRSIAIHRHSLNLFLAAGGLTVLTSSF